MKVETVAITKLRADEKNPRVMKPAEAEALKRSLDEFGAVEPAVVNRDGMIIGGHQRVLAAIDLGWTEFPVVRLDLSKEKARLLNLALNRIDGERDMDQLGDLLAELDAGPDQLALSGFNEPELTQILDNAAAGEQPDAAEPGAVPKRPRTKPGDLIRLGDHRLLCGDARDRSGLERLFGEDRADMVWTDPPYGVDYEGKTPAALKIDGDGDGAHALAADVFTAVTQFLQPGAAFYCAAPSGPAAIGFLLALQESTWRLRQMLVWDKETMVLGRSDYHYVHELILYGYLPGRGRRGRGSGGWFGTNSATSLLRYPKPSASREHPTMKPVELVEDGLRNSSKPAQLVLDPFLGSGSTLLACEGLGRRCIGTELDPGYCDVIVKRWEDTTGRKARRPRRKG